MSDEEKYLKSLANIKKGYIIALIVSAVIFASSICSAMIYSVLLGLALLVLAIVTYAAITTRLLYDNLGISYKAYHGCLTVTGLYGKNREVVYIPDKLIMLTVTEIGNRAFTHESSKSIREIYIPKSILRIGTSAFAKLPALTDLYYEGSEEEWTELSRLAPLEDVNLHFNVKMPDPKSLKSAKQKKNKENTEK